MMLWYVIKTRRCVGRWRVARGQSSDAGPDQSYLAPNSSIPRRFACSCFVPECVSPTNRAVGHRGFLLDSRATGFLSVSVLESKFGQRPEQKEAQIFQPGRPCKTRLHSAPCCGSHRPNACLRKGLHCSSRFQAPVCSGDGRRRLSSLFARLACVRHGGRRTWTNNGWHFAMLFLGLHRRGTPDVFLYFISRPRFHAVVPTLLQLFKVTFNILLYMHALHLPSVLTLWFRATKRPRAFDIPIHCSPRTTSRPPPA